MFARVAVPKLLYLLSDPMDFPLSGLKNIMLPMGCRLLIEKNLYIHPVPLENITVTVNSAVNAKTWVSGQIDGGVGDQEGVLFHG